jgi:hypothetical protein
VEQSNKCEISRDVLLPERTQFDQRNDRGSLRRFSFLPNRTQFTGYDLKARKPASSFCQNEPNFGNDRPRGFSVRQQ